MSYQTSAAAGRFPVSIPYRHRGSQEELEQILRDVGLDVTVEVFSHSVTYRTKAGDVLTYWPASGTVNVVKTSHGALVDQLTEALCPNTLDAYFS